jgi:hypothetical protein
LFVALRSCSSCFISTHRRILTEKSLCYISLSPRCGFFLGMPAKNVICNKMQGNERIGSEKGRVKWDERCSEEKNLLKKKEQWQNRCVCKIRTENCVRVTDLREILEQKVEFTGVEREDE